MSFIKKELGRAEHSLSDMLRQETASAFGNSLYHSFVPSLAFIREKRKESGWLLERQMTELIPLYGFTMEQCQEDIWKDDNIMILDEILLAEGREEPTEEEPKEAEMTEDDMQEVSLEELLQAENEAALEAAHLANTETAFVPHTLQNQVDMARLQNYETLVQDFYTIDKNTMAGSDQLNAEKLLEQDLRISKDGEGPQILIYHTHSQEGFADSVPGDASTTIMGVGDRLAEILQNTYGYEVLHHTGQYDVDSRDDAYSKSLPAIEQVLQENPSVQVIIDLHRDQMAEETRLVMDVDGRPTARFMFFNGLSRTRKTGNISYLYNEYQEENLAFSFQMQLKAQEYYPGLTRKIYLKGYRYNMHLRPRTLLVELGAQNNTLEEAMNACDPLAHILDMVLSGQ